MAGNLRSAIVAWHHGGMVQEGGDPHVPWWEDTDSVSRLGPLHDPDRYKVLETASAGAEGSVLRGELLLDGNPIPVAIKVLHESQSDLGEWEKRWNRQTEILRTVQHPCLVTVREAFVGARAHSLGSSGGTPDGLYLVMNWASGPTLDDWAQGKSTPEVLEVLGSLADAIDYLHRGEGSNGIGVIHRDIKPANVIVDAGTPILVDFGFARFARSTDETVVVYSRSFAAPEVMRGEPPDASADRFAFGATALRVITGRTVAKCSVAEVQEALAATGVPANLTAHLAATLDPDPHKRPADLGPWYQYQLPGAAPPPPPALVVPIPTPGESVPGAAGTVMRSRSASSQHVHVAPTLQGPSRSNATTVVTSLVLGLLIVAAIALGVFLWAGSQEPSEVVIPEMVGSTKEHAIKLIEQLPVSASIEPVESTSEPGIVVSVSPAEGSAIEAGAKVTVEYASQSFTMPELTGQPAQDAARELVSRGISEDKIKYRALAEENSTKWCLVQAQAPDPNEPVDRDSEAAVHVAVAPGKAVESCLPDGG